MKPHYTLITGASQGLGKAFAINLAKRQENLILISLPNSKQKELTNYLSNNFKIKVYQLELDLSKVENYEVIAEYVKKHDLQIKYLINNAGVLSRGAFDTLSNAYILKQIEVNVIAPTILIRLFLDNLKRNASSGILNVSSLAAFFPLVHKQVYCGTKAYILSFSKSLRKELKKDNVGVSTLCPGGLNTTTRLCYQNRILGWISRSSVLSPEKAVQIALKGLLRKQDVIIPGKINNCFIWIDKIVPQFIKDYLTEREIKKFKIKTFQA